MSGWRLKVRNEAGLTEVLNLDSMKNVYVGDDTQNEICVASTEIPTRLKMVQGRGQQIRIRLTDEVLPSFKGSTEGRKKWKSPLYTGEILDVAGDASWKLGRTEFKLFKEEKILLVSGKDLTDPMERKQFWKSIGLSSLTHLGLLLILLLGGFVLRQFQDAPAEDPFAKAEKVSVAEIKQIFQPREEIIIQEEAPATIIPEEIKPEEAKKTGPVSPTAKIPSKAGAKTKALAAATMKSNTPAKANVNAMGLLGVQAARNTQARSLNIEQAKVFNPDPNAKTSGMGINSMGQGVRAGVQTQQVAQLNGVAVGGYQSGAVSKQINASRAPAVQLVRKEIEIRGGLDPAVIQQIVQERLAEVRYCYENALLADVNLGGKISTSWTIQANGSVADLSALSDDPRMQKIHGCIKERMGRWKFPEPKGGGVVHVKYPFVFSSLGS